MERPDFAQLAYHVVEPNNKDGSDKTPIIMLHGMTSIRHTWNTLSQSLADKTGTKVYLLDARNHGDSDWKEEHNYKVMAEDVGNFMEQHNIPTAIMIGHSMGGKTAMVLATTEPNKVEKLIIEDISPRNMGPTPKRFPFKYLKLMRSSLEVIPPSADLETAKEVVADFLYTNTPTIHQSSPDRKPLASVVPLQKDEDGFSWKVNLDVLETQFFRKENPLNQVQGSFDKPVVFIYGTRSPYNVPEDKDLIMDIFPQAQFWAVEGATHLVHMEYPEDFLENVLKFLM